MRLKIVLISILMLISSVLYAEKLTFVTIEFPPYVFTNNGEIEGFNVDILKKIFMKMNVDFEIVIMPWNRAVHFVKTGKADAIFPFFKNPERLKFTDYTDSFTSESHVFFVKKNSGIDWTGDLSHLKNFKFGRVTGYSSGDTFDNAVKNGSIRLDEVSKTTLNVKKFIKGRFDILVENKYVALHELKKLGKLDDVKLLDPPVNNGLAYLGFSKRKNRMNIVNQFNQILKQMKADGSYQQVIDNYFKK